VLQAIVALVALIDDARTFQMTGGIVSSDVGRSMRMILATDGTPLLFRTNNM